tara:strand:- start:88 stop:900 length:813 start_codon:yes stop_codon:yes gene_type:complete
MISIYLQGGLGNQLFQIFTLIAYSLKHKIPFTLPETKEYLVLQMYGEIYKRPLYFDNFLKNLKPFLDNKFQHQVLYREKGFFYTELPFCKENMLLTGYFQSYKYFDSYKNNILKLIYCENYKKSPINNTISIHFRIGDYKHNTNKHPVLSVDYYIKSLQHIIKKTNKDNWVIVYFFEKKDIKEVSEKIDNIKSHFKNLTFKKCDQNLSDWEEMISMSSCKHNIIANSTFSWWGAYLNENNDKIVCYPSVWFGNELQTQINDLFLDDWKKI